MLLFFAGGSRKKSYEVSKFGGGVYALNEFFEKFITFMNFFLQHSGQHHTVRSVHRFFYACEDMV